MLTKFVVWRKHGKSLSFVEGDDSLTVSTVKLTSDDFRKPGFDIKILVHQDICQTGFCGLTMSPDGCALCDPAETLLNFGWTHSLMMHGGHKVRMGLLRAKALSLLYQTPRCPIVSALAIRFIGLTTGFEARFETNWWEQKMNQETALYEHWTKTTASMGVSDQARVAFDQLYNISPDTQRIIENNIQSYGLGPITDPVLLNALNFSRDAYDYCDRYVRDVPLGCPSSGLSDGHF